MYCRKLVLGLGNPGEKYRNTSHNLGFQVVDRLAAESGVRWHRGEFQALITHSKINEIDLILAKPQTFMNLSGQSAALLMSHYELAIEDLIVVLDDLAIPFGKIRIRGRGRAGGHKGLESIIACLSSHEFIRIRLGIGLEGEMADAAEYVLRPIPKSLGNLADEMVVRGKDAVKAVCVGGLQAAMNQFN